MIPKSGYRFSEMIMPKEQAKRNFDQSKIISLQLFLGAFKAQAADEHRITKARAQIVNGVFRQRRAAIDKIGGVGRGG